MPLGLCKKVIGVWEGRSEDLGLLRICDLEPRVQECRSGDEEHSLIIGSSTRPWRHRFYNNVTPAKDMFRTRNLKGTDRHETRLRVARALTTKSRDVSSQRKSRIYPTRITFFITCGGGLG